MNVDPEGKVDLSTQVSPNEPREASAITEIVSKILGTASAEVPEQNLNATNLTEEERCEVALQILQSPDADAVITRIPEDSPLKEAVMFEQALMDLNEDSFVTLDNFERYGIKSETLLLKFASKSASVNPATTMHFMKTFNIESESDRYSIVKQMADSKVNISRQINKADLSDEHLLELAKHNAKNHPSSTIKYISKFKIADSPGESERFTEVFMIAAKENPALIFNNKEILSEFTEQQKLTLATEAMAFNCEEACKIFDKFEIESEDTRLFFAASALLHSLNNFDHIDKFDLDLNGEKPVFSADTFNSEKSSAIQKHIFSHKVYENIKNDQKAEASYKKELAAFGRAKAQAKKEGKEFDLSAKPKKPKASKKPTRFISQELIEKTLRIHNPLAREKLSGIILRNPSSAESPLQVIENALKEKLGVSEKLLKDSAVSEQLILVVAQLVSQEVPSKEQVRVIKTCFASKKGTEVAANLKSLRGLLGMQRADLLSEISSAKDIKPLLTLSFMEAFDFSGIDDFTKKYEQTLATFRNPDALFTYYGNMCNLEGADKEGTMKDLGFVVRSIVTGEFEKVRYENNPHLDSVGKKCDLDLWKQNRSYSTTIADTGVDERIEKETKVTVSFTDDPNDLILMGTDMIGSCQKVDGNPNLCMALAGTVRDGKNKLVAIKDPETGLILSRAILRIMDTDKEPALLFETIYPQTSSYAFNKELMKAAKDVADTMGLKLYKSSIDPANVEDITLRAHESPSYCEYIDSSSGKIFGGNFTVDTLELIS